MSSDVGKTDFELEKVLSEVAKELPKMAAFADQDGHVFWVNQAFTTVTGYSVNELDGLNFWHSVLDKNSDDDQLSALTDSVSNRTAFEGEILAKHRSGSPMWVELSLKPIYADNSEFLGFASFLEDISVRKKRTQYSQERELQNQRLLDSLGEALFRTDLSGKIRLLTQAWAEITGYSQDESIGKPEVEFIHPPDREIYAAMQKEIRDGAKSVQRSLRLQQKDGEVRWVERKVRPNFDSLGEMDGVVGTLRDTHIQRNAEDALKESQARYELILSGSKDGIWDWEIKTGKTFFSNRYKEMLGYKPDELEDSVFSWITLVHPGDYPRVDETLQNYLDGHTPFYEAEFRMVHRDGSWRWILARGVATRDEQGNAIRMAGSHTDVTARRTWE